MGKIYRMQSLRERQARTPAPYRVASPAFSADRSIDYLKLLVESGISLGEIDETESLLDYIANISLEMAGCEGATIYKVEPGKLCFLISHNRVLERNTVPVHLKGSRIDLKDSSIAGYAAVHKQVVNIADVYRLPPDSPFHWNSTFDQASGYRTRSIMAIPMTNTKGEVFGVLQLINHVQDGKVVSFPKATESYLRAMASQAGVVLRNAYFADELRLARIETVLRFVAASECRDNDTGGHVERMSAYSSIIYHGLGKSDQDVEVMKLASMLHDVGKISIPDAILKKPGKLDSEEWEIMRSHAVAGYKMLRDAESPFLRMGATIAWAHHEKWDGTGYPRGLKGTEIPLEGRVVAIADVFDALSSRRCYKEAWPIEKVLETIRQDAGTHFDPELVEVFFENIDEILAVCALRDASDSPLAPFSLVAPDKPEDLRVPLKSAS